MGLSPLLGASRAPHADIVHIGDYVSSRGSRKHNIAYVASNAAQDNFTLSFSARLAPKVKVNSIDHLLNSSYVTGRVLHVDSGRHLK